MTTDKAPYLVDTSAIIRFPYPQVAEALTSLIEDGKLASCAVIDLKLFARVHDVANLRGIRASKTKAFRWLSTTDDDLRRALDIQAQLAEQGQHPTSWAALVVAAVAQRHEAVVLHYHSLFDHIAKLTGQDMRWVVAQGELPYATPEYPRADRTGN